MFSSQFQGIIAFTQKFRSSADIKICKVDERRDDIEMRLSVGLMRKSFILLDIALLDLLISVKLLELIKSSAKKEHH